MCPFPVAEWDDDGYPTEASLAALAAPPEGDDPAVVWTAVAPWLRAELARCAECCCASYREEPFIGRRGERWIRLHFSTGGWSGAEDLIDALLGRFEIRHYHVQWNKGGHYIFEVPA